MAVLEASPAVLRGDYLCGEARSTCAASCCYVGIQVIGLGVDGDAVVFIQGGGVVYSHWGLDEAHVFEADVAAQLTSGDAKANQVKA